MILTVSLASLVPHFSAFFIFSYSMDSVIRIVKPVQFRVSAIYYRAYLTQFFFFTLTWRSLSVQRVKIPRIPIDEARRYRVSNDRLWPVFRSTCERGIRIARDACWMHRTIEFPENKRAIVTDG